MSQGRLPIRSAQVETATFFGAHLEKEDDMSEAIPAQQDKPAPRSSMRDRILQAATSLFYENGIRATSADRVIEMVGITKVTFYRHFRTKDDLVVAYLEQRAAWERGAVEQARVSGGGARGALHLIAQGIGGESCKPGFRGCPFINAAAEYADPGHPVRTVVDTHRRWFHEAMARILGDVDVPDRALAADELVMLRDGAMVSGYLSDPERVTATLDAGYRAVLARTSDNDLGTASR
jgi:AcrR family transcriptional regulator